MNNISWSLIFTVCFIAYSYLGAEARESDDKIIIAGTITNYDKSSFMLQYDAFDLLRSTENIRVNIKDNGEFKLEMETESPFQGRLSFGKIMIKSTGHYRYIYVYLEPGDSLYVKADVNEIEQTLSFSGSGVDNNIFVNEEDYTFNTYPQRVKNNYAFIAHSKPNEYKHKIDSMEVKKLKYLDTYNKSNELSPTLYDAYRWRYINDAVIRKINYPSSHKGFNDGQAADLPADYYDFIDDVKIASDLDDKGLPYLRFTHFYLTNTYKLAKEDGYDKEYLPYIKSQLNGRALYVYMAYSLGYDFDPVIYSQFGENCPYADIRQIVSDKYKHLESMLPGQPAPEVTLVNMKGEEVSLADFKGKYIYLDFWATWCKPCIKEIPSLVKVEEEYHDKEIVFVSISTDENKEKWADFVESKQLTGIQVWADGVNKKVFNETFNIRMIPRFVLIDDEGNIVDANAPRPSQQELLQLLNKELL